MKTAANEPPTLRRITPISKPPQRNFQRRDTGPRVNDRIRAPKIRVIEGASARQLGIMTPQEALTIARQYGLDLVEIAPTAQPPVCKIVNFGKWKYEQAKHEKEKHKSKGGKSKEVKFRMNIDPHDYKIKMTRAEDFLWHGDKLRLQMQFRGREQAHPEIGMALMQKVKADLKTMSHVDMEPRQTGKTINMTLSPLPEGQRIRKFRAQDEKFVHDEDDSDMGHADDDEHHDDEGHEPEAPESAK